MVLFGPLQMFVFGFPGNEFKGEILPALNEARDEGIIRVIDYMFVLKDKNGLIYEVEGSDLGRSEMLELGAGIGALMGLGAGGLEGAEIGAVMGAEAAAEHGIGFTQEDMDQVAKDIPKNSAALIMIVEHLWAKNLKQALINSNAVMIAHGMLPIDMFIKIGAMMATETETAKKSTPKKKPRAKKGTTKKKAATGKRK